MGADYTFYVKTIENHARTFLPLNISAVGSVLDEFSDSASDRIVLYNMSRKTINRQKVDMEEKSALSLNFFQHTVLPLSASQKTLRRGDIPLDI